MPRTQVWVRMWHDMDQDRIEFHRFASYDDAAQYVWEAIGGIEPLDVIKRDLHDGETIEDGDYRWDYVSPVIVFHDDAPVSV